VETVLVSNNDKLIGFLRSNRRFRDGAPVFTNLLAVPNVGKCNMLGRNIE